MFVLSTDESCRDTVGEVATFHDTFYEPNEKSVTLRLKYLMSKNEVTKAERLLAEIGVSTGRLHVIDSAFLLLLPQHVFFNLTG